jgi:midasin (ATPase involved in ribosome maturation)
MKLIGMDLEVSEALRALRRNAPVMFYGPTGNGKTLAAWEVAKQMEKESGVPIVYLQLYPEMTKNSLIGGETIKAGSIVIEEQALLKMGCGKGAIFIVDECTHTTEPVILAFNSLIEEPYSTVVGDKIYKLSEKTRFIFCGNFPDHAGNIHLPISFANRLYIIKTGMPSKEILCQIANEANPKAPANLMTFIADLILTCHEPAFPVAPRNIVTAAQAVPGLFGTGYKKGVKITNKGVEATCKEHDIDQNLLKRTIMSSLMANVIVTSVGPEKIEALLWE